MDEKICVIVVCYNNLIEKTNIIKTCLKITDSIDILIFDNSNLNDIALKNKNFAKSQEILYLSKDKNLGLSSAYNLAINFVKENLGSEWLTIFDQDTKVDVQYFKKLRESINQDPNFMIHVPIVNHKNGRMSPLKFNRWSQSRFDIIEKSYNNLACINSGTTLNSSIYEKIGGYDEKIFLDLVDYDFFRRIYKMLPDKKIKIFEYQIKQEFSGDSFSTFELDYTRFKIYIDDFNCYCKNWNIKFFYKMFVLMKRAIKLASHHRNISFIKQAFKNL